MNIHDYEQAFCGVLLPWSAAMLRLHCAQVLPQGRRGQRLILRPRPATAEEPSDRRRTTPWQPNRLMCSLTTCEGRQVGQRLLQAGQLVALWSGRRGRGCRGGRGAGREVRCAAAATRRRPTRTRAAVAEHTPAPARGRVAAGATSSATCLRSTHKQKAIRSPHPFAPTRYIQELQVGQRQHAGRDAVAEVVLGVGAVAQHGRRRQPQPCQAA